MELSMDHRNSLLAALEAAQEDRDLKYKCLNSEALKEDHRGTRWFEIEHWLAIQRICLIKSAIAKNEIDY